MKIMGTPTFQGKIMNTKSNKIVGMARKQHMAQKPNHWWVEPRLGSPNEGSRESSRRRSIYPDWVIG